MPTRLGFTIKPNLNSLVLVSKGARISRPKAMVAGIEVVIKNDQLAPTIGKSMDEAYPLIIAKLIGADTLESVARGIARLHAPIAFDWRAKFGLSDAPRGVGAADAVSAPVSQPGRPSAPPVPAEKTRVQATEPADEAQKPKQKLICHACGAAVAYNVAKFCWFNKPRFGGNIFCMDCQKAVPGV